MGEFFGDEGPTQAEVEQALDHLKNRGTKPTEVLVSRRNSKEILIGFGGVAITAKALVDLHKRRNLSLESIKRCGDKNTK